MQLYSCHGTAPALRTTPLRRPTGRMSLPPPHASSSSTTATRRDLLASTSTLTLGLCAAQMATLLLPGLVRDGAHGTTAWGAADASDDFVTTASGLRYYDIK